MPPLRCTAPPRTCGRWTRYPTGLPPEAILGGAYHGWSYHWGSSGLVGCTCTCPCGPLWCVLAHPHVHPQCHPAPGPPRSRSQPHFDTSRRCRPPVPFPFRRFVLSCFRRHPCSMAHGHAMALRPPRALATRQPAPMPLPNVPRPAVTLRHGSSSAVIPVTCLRRRSQTET